MVEVANALAYYGCNCKKFYKTNSFVISCFHFSLNQQKLEQQLKIFFPIFCGFCHEIKTFLFGSLSEEFLQKPINFFDSKLENPEYGN